MIENYISLPLFCLDNDVVVEFNAHTIKVHHWISIMEGEEVKGLNHLPNDIRKHS